MTSHLDSDFLSRLRSKVGSGILPGSPINPLDSSIISEESSDINEMSFSTYKDRLKKNQVFETPSSSSMNRQQIGLTPDGQTPLVSSPIDTFYQEELKGVASTSDSHYNTKFTPKSKTGYILSPSLFATPSSPLQTQSSNNRNFHNNDDDDPLGTLATADSLSAKTDDFVRRLREGGSHTSVNNNNNNELLSLNNRGRMIGKDNVYGGKQHSSRRTLQVAIREVLLNGTKVMDVKNNL